MDRLPINLRSPEIRFPDLVDFAKDDPVPPSKGPSLDCLALKIRGKRWLEPRRAAVLLAKGGRSLARRLLVRPVRRARSLLLGRAGGRRDGGGRLEDAAAGAARTSPPPHYGGKLREQIERARARSFSKAFPSADYRTVRAEFDFGFYLTRYADLAREPDLDLVQHYLRHGAKEGRDPSPDFSTRIYSQRYSEVRGKRVNPFAHWIAVGRSKGYSAAPFADFERLCEMLGLAPDETEVQLNGWREDVRRRLHHGTLGEMVQKAAALEPLISRTWPESFAPKLPPFHSDATTARAAAMHRLHEQAQFQRARAVVLTNRARWGCSRRMEGDVADALAERYSAEEVVVVTTDAPGAMAATKVPRGVRCIDFATAAASLNAPIKQRLLVEFLRSLRPFAAFNINSRLLWDALGPYGKALTHDMRVFAALLCDEQTVYGHWTGYPLEKFYRHFDLLAAVVTDSAVMAERLAAQYALPPEQKARIVVLRAPVSADHPAVFRAERAPGSRPQIFWSGRFDRQKRIDLVVRLAALMPHADFHVWGGSVLQNSSLPAETPPNLQHHGIYERIDELPLEAADVWLYTAEWDGVPNVLLEMSTRGIPIVGSLVGGTGEILKPDLAWPVADIDNPWAYRAAIEEVIAAPEAARQRALRMRRVMLAERGPEHYRRTLFPLLPTEA